MAGIADIAILVDEGNFNVCANLKVTGISHDGGYAEYMITPANAAAHMPEELSLRLKQVPSFVLESPPIILCADVEQCLVISSPYWASVV